MNWADEKQKIRRFLRDPNANIWEDALLLNLYNDEQKFLQIATNFLEDIQAVRVPPIYETSYLYDWEFRHLESGANHQALNFYHQGEMVFCYRWETTAIAELGSDPPDEGEHATHPWEYFINLNPGELIELRFPDGFDKALWVGWDKEPIEYLDQKQISSDDTTWLTRMGDPQGYWRPNLFEDVFYLYPQPNSPTWDDLDGTYDEASYIYAYDWEEAEAYLSSTGGIFTREYSDQGYVFDWEYDHLSTGSAPLRDQYGMRCMSTHELTASDGSVNVGMMVYSSDVDYDTDNIDTSPAYLFNQDLGIVTDAVDADDNVLFIYRKNPTDIENTSDQSDFPDFLRKYLSYGVLERAYMADTDGQIKSLWEYWAMRKKAGIEAVKTFMRKRRQDRDYRLTTKGVPPGRTRRDPRLPEHYPAIPR